MVLHTCSWNVPSWSIGSKLRPLQGTALGHGEGTLHIFSTLVHVSCIHEGPLEQHFCCRIERLPAHCWNCLSANSPSTASVVVDLCAHLFWWCQQWSPRCSFSQWIGVALLPHSVDRHWRQGQESNLGQVAASQKELCHENQQLSYPEPSCPLTQDIRSTPPSYRVRL